MRKFKKIWIAILAFTLVVAVAAAAALIWSRWPKETVPQFFTSVNVQGSSASEASGDNSVLHTGADVVTTAPHGYSVSTSNDTATQIGMSVLEAGGNAVDAAVAIAYILSVEEQSASGLGGSGGMLVYDPSTQECKFYDYRAAASSAEKYPGTIGIPGMVAGMEYVHDIYGSISMADLIAPAIFYAEQGSYTALAETLRTVQEGGAQAFYTGKIAEDVAGHSGITVEDMANYQVYEYDALAIDYRGYTVYGANAPMSGITVLQMLEMEELLDIPDPAEDPANYINTLQDITFAVYSDRKSILGDPAYRNIDLTEKLTSAYLLELLELDVAEMNDDEECPDTTSFSVVDANGLTVTATNTLTQFWGSGIVVDGFYLNNTNANFTNQKINAYEPGKRSRTYSAPIIVTGEDGLVMAIGTPGGNNIPVVLFDVLLKLLKYDMDPQQAVTKARVIYSFGILTVEEGNDWLDTYEMHHTYAWRETGSWWGSISLAGYSDDTGAFAAFDSRRGATMAGVYN